MKAYRQDFAAVARLLTAGSPGDIALADITKRKMRGAFAAYASTHEPASIRRCWSTWNVLCDFLYTADLIPANPMPFVGRPKASKTLPRSLPQPAVGALLEAVDGDHASQRRTDWAERDLALILTGLLAGLGSPLPRHHGIPRGHGLSQWSANAPLFVGRDGERITRVTIQSRVRRAFRRAGPDAQPVHGALVHGLRHTYATELANSGISVYTLISSWATSRWRHHSDTSPGPPRNPHRRRTKPALRSYSRSPTSVEHA